jgi:hypothetical protein
LHIFDSAKKTAAPTEFSPSLGAPGLKILMLGSCPEDFFFFQNQGIRKFDNSVKQIQQKKEIQQLSLSLSSVFIV